MTAIRVPVHIPGPISISKPIPVAIAIGSLIHGVQLFLVGTVMTAASGKVIHPLLSIVQ